MRDADHNLYVAEKSVVHQLWSRVKRYPCRSSKIVHMAQLTVLNM